jgi:hypothetical protein
MELVTDVKFTPDGRPDSIQFGDVEHFTSVVLNGPGRQFLSRSVDDLVKRPSIADVDMELARDAAVNLIEAAKRAEIFSIGGPVLVYRVDRAGAARLPK